MADKVFAVKGPILKPIEESNGTAGENHHVSPAVLSCPDKTAYKWEHFIRKQFMNELDNSIIFDTIKLRKTV